MIINENEELPKPYRSKIYDQRWTRKNNLFNLTILTDFDDYIGHFKQYTHKRYYDYNW